MFYSFKGNFSPRYKTKIINARIICHTYNPEDFYYLTIKGNESWLELTICQELYSVIPREKKMK